MKMRKLMLFFIIVCLLVIGIFAIYSTTNAAEEYPTKPITAIVPYNAGGSTDRSLRMIQPFLEEELGVPVVVENHPGAGTEIGSTLLYRAPADGYTFEAIMWAEMILTTIFQNPIYQYEDFNVLLLQNVDPRVLLVRKDSALNNLTDIIEEAKRNPGKLAFSTTTGNQELLLRALRNKFKIDFRIVIYDGGSTSRGAMIGGHTDGAMGEASGAYYLRDQTKCAVLFDDKPNSLWPECEPFTDLIKAYGVEMPTLPAIGIYMVRQELREQYPDRYNKLVDAFLRASKNPKYLELADKAEITRVLVWKGAEEYSEMFDDQYKFIKETKYLWEEK